MDGAESNPSTADRSQKARTNFFPTSKKTTRNFSDTCLLRRTPRVTFYHWAMPALTASYLDIVNEFSGLCSSDQHCIPNKQLKAVSEISGIRT